MSTLKIDINCDVGEGFGNEASLFPFITSCNIACGGHAGDMATMQRVLQLATNLNVRAGAHPSYPDRVHFGRNSMSLPEHVLAATITEQIQTFTKAAKGVGVKMHHIKAHGALYNDMVADRELALVYLKAIRPYVGDSLLYVPYGSVISREAISMGFNIVLEAFGDRLYNEDLSLASRNSPGSVISDPGRVLAQIVSIAQHKKVITPKGAETGIEARTFCIHGDTPSALQILMYLNSELPKYNITLEK